MGKAKRNRARHVTHTILRETHEQTERDAHKHARDLIRLVWLALILVYLVYENGKTADWAFAILACIETNVRTFLRASR